MIVMVRGNDLEKAVMTLELYFGSDEKHRHITAMTDFFFLRPEAKLCACRIHIRIVTAVVIYSLPTTENYYTFSRYWL
jgi:hypothetical protein